MSTPVKTIFIELRASADRLKADMAESGTALDKVGAAGQLAGQKVAGGVSVASESFGKLARTAVEAGVAIEGLMLAAAKYSGIAAASAGSTEQLVNSYRGLRIALDPSMFTVASVAVGILVEQTIRLTMARAKLIEQQALLAATSGRSIGGIESIHEASSVSGSSDSKIQGLIAAVSKNATDSPVNYKAGLASIGQTPSEADAKQWVDELGDIAKAFDSIDDPAKRAALAVQLFGKEHAGEALEQLNRQFAEGVAAVNDYGLSLGTVDRTQIFQFRQDIEGLKDPLGGLRVELKSVGEAAELAFAKLGGAADANFHRAISVIDILLSKLPGVAATMAAVNGEKSLSPKELQPNAANRDYLNVQAGKQADDSFAGAKESIGSLRKQQSDAQDIADADYKLLDEDRKKRKENPKDSSLMSGDQRMATEAQRQGAAHDAIFLQGKVTAMQEALDAEKKAEALAKQLAEYQAGAAGRLNSLYQSTTEQGIKDPVARQMFEGRVEVQRDADRTTPAEKQGRATIVTGQLQAAAAALQLKQAQEYLAQQAKDASAELGRFGKELQQSSEDLAKKAEGQRKIDSVEMEGARGEGEHSVRMAGIQSQPGNEAQLAKDVLAIRLQTVAAERAILDAHRESYTVEQGQAADDRLDNEAKAANLAYTEQIAARQKDLQQSALQTGGAYQQHLLLIQQQFDALNSIVVTSKNALDIETARIGLNKQLLEAQIAQAQSSGQNAGSVQLQLAEQNAQTQLRQWNSIGAGTAGADVINQLMQLPQEVSSSLVSSIFDAPKRGQSKGQEILGGLAKTGEQAGKQLATKLLTDGIEKLIATLIPQAVFASAQTTATTANTAALIANTAAQGASAGAGAAGAGASAAGSVASSAASSGEAAATGGASLLAPLIGGVISGVISAAATFIGDARIVKAVNETTAAIYSLRQFTGGTGNGLTTPGTQGNSQSNSQPPPTQGFFQGILSGIFTAFTGAGAIDVNVVSINPLAGVAGLFHLFGFDEGGPVTHDMVARVHKGEHVLNADQVAGRAPLPGFLRGAQFPSTEDYMSTGGSTVAPGGGDSFSGNHTFHIYETANARETADQVARHLTTMLPSLSKYAR